MAKYERYSAKAVKGPSGNIGDLGESKQKKTPYVSVVFEVTDGEHKGKQFEWQGYFSEATSERTLQSLMIAGCTFPGDDTTNLAGLGSKEVEIQVEDTEYGKRVAWVNAPRVSSVTDDNRLSGGAKKALAGQLKGALLALKGGTSAAKPKPVGPDPFAAPPANQVTDETTSDGEAPAATGTDDRYPF